MGARVLVTRPEPAASSTAVQLAALGFEPVVLPLSRTVSLTVPAIDGGVDFVAVTSANALRHASEAVLGRLRSIPCFAVGDRTARAAASAGFAEVTAANGDVGALIALLAQRAKRGGRIAYLCGRVRRPDFEVSGLYHGWDITPIGTYDTLGLLPSNAEIEQVADAKPVDYVLVYSVKAAEALNELLDQPAATKWLNLAVFCCLSSRIADALGVDKARIRVAARPEQDALLAVLPSRA